MTKALCVLYDDPVSGHPNFMLRMIPKVQHYPGGQTTSTPKQIDFKPGDLLGSVSGELGLRKFVEDLGHTFVPLFQL
jgi:formate dehydrogenase